MEFMSFPGEEAIVLAWADSSKGLGYVKKIPVKYSVSATTFPKYSIPQMLI
jgi:hypothetical protein